jgi:hypothetical protein
MTGHAFLPLDPIPDLLPNVTARGQLIKWPERYRARVNAARRSPGKAKISYFDLKNPRRGL